MAITSAPEPFRAPGRPVGAAGARTEEYYARYARTVSGLCRALLRDRSEAEDATQQVFLSAYRALLNGSEPREPAAWLATIARNECWARVRARMREPLPSAEIEDADGSLPDPLAEAIRRADLAALWAAIGDLPRQQRDALLLREFGGLSYDELGAALAVSTPAVESLLFRARTRLRTQLKAAYAALTGASWLDALVRLLAGGSAPAAKAVALGLGAAAVTGGAVVAPQAFFHEPRPARPAHAAVRPSPGVFAPAAAPVAAVSSPALAPPKEPAVFRVAEPRDRSHDSQDGRRSGGGRESRDSAASTEHDSGGGGGAAEQQSRPSGEDGGDSGGTATTTDAAPTTAPTAEQPAAQDGGGDTSNQTTTTTESIPAVTVTLPSVDGSGGDG